MTGLHVLRVAWHVTKPRTKAEAVHCNVRFSQARDALMHGPPLSAALAGVSITEAEYDAHRETALIEMRAACRACGLCVEVGLAPP